MQTVTIIIYVLSLSAPSFVGVQFYFTFLQIRSEKKLGATSNHPTMSLDKSVIGTTPNTVSGQCPTCKNSHP